MVGGRKRRDFQVMGYTLNEPALLRPETALDVIDLLAREQYDAVRVFLRQTNFSHRSPQVIEVVAAMVERAHRAGLRVALDCEPHYPVAARDMGQQFPEAMGERLVRVACRPVDGHFRLHIPAPITLAPSPLFGGVEAAFVRRGDEVHLLEEFAFDLHSVVEAYDDGYTVAEVDMRMDKPGLGKLVFHLVGRLPGAAPDELIVYAHLTDHGLTDFWAEGFHQYYDELLECYRDVPLDGVGWDEPAEHVFWDVYAHGRSFAAAFERLNGYALRERLYLLDEPETSPEAMEVRLDYYRTLNEGVYEAQRRLVEKARELFGPDLLFGTHHTWMGEGTANDYRAGAGDYFRLNQNMDAGYTDNCWWDDGSVCYTYVLASSLGRLTPSGAAECNTWHWTPTNALVDYYSRFMSLMRINWFNIFCGDCTDMVKYPDHYTWDRATECMRRNRRFLQLLGEARPVADVAVWHGWEGAMAINRAEWASAHKAFLINTSEQFVHRNLAFDFVDSDLLAQANVSNGTLETALGSYRVLIMPYATAMPDAVWRNCVNFAETGGLVVFVGPPPAQTIEGDSLSEEFARRLGMSALPLDTFLGHVESVCDLPSERPAQLDITYPLQPDGGQALTSAEDELHGVVGPGGNLVYLSDLDPRHRLVDVVESRITPPVVCHSDSILWRLYRDGQRDVLMLIARRHRQMRGLVQFSGEELEISQGVLALVESREGGIEVHGDNVEWTLRGAATSGK